MPNFDPATYETVDERLRRFWADNQSGRIRTELVSAAGEVGSTRWVVRADVYRDAANSEPTATGYAFEVDGTSMANKGSALENCETSAIGRALANAGYSGNKRANRQEMVKAFLVQARGEIAEATTRERLRELWAQAQHAGVLDDLRELLMHRLGQLDAAEDNSNEPTE